MTFRTNNSSPTLTSFYTVAEKTKRSTKPSKTTNSVPTVPTNGITSRIKNTWVASKSIEDATAYLTLRAKLSQVIFNRFTILFILLAVNIHLFAVMLNYCLGNVQSYLALTCTTLSQSSLSSNITFELTEWLTQTSLQSLQNQVDAVNSQTSSNLNSTLSNILVSSTNYISVLADSYDQLARSSANSALTAATNSTVSLHNWLNDTLTKAVSSTSADIQSITNALTQLQNSLNRNSELFSNVQLGSILNINLNNISSITLPLAVNSELINLASQTDFGFDSIAANASVRLNNLLSNFTQNSQFTTKLSINYNNNSDTPAYNPSSSDSGICPISNSNKSVNSLFQQVTDQISQLRKTYVIMFSCFAVLAIILSGLFELFLWRNLLRQARALTTPGNFQDPIENIKFASQPTVSWIGMKLGLFFENEKTRTLVRWTISYILSPVALFLLGCFAFLLTMYLCESSMIHVLSIASKTSIIVNTGFSNSGASNNTVKDLINTINSAVSSAQIKTNANLQTTLSDALNKTHFVLSVFESDLSNNLQSLFESSNISSSFPSDWSIKSTIPVNTLTYSEAIYPQLNENAILPPRQTVSNASIASAGITSPQIISLQTLIETFDGIAGTHLKLSLSFLGLWFALLIVSFVAFCLKDRS